MSNSRKRSEYRFVDEMNRVEAESTVLKKRGLLGEAAKNQITLHDFLNSYELVSLRATSSS